MFLSLILFQREAVTFNLKGQFVFMLDVYKIQCTVTTAVHFNIYWKYSYNLLAQILELDRPQM